ncbi:MAG: hypothetical protein ABWY04_16360 [Arthrobacter sp.]
MDHKLQLTIRADLDTNGLGLQVRGCLTGAAFPVLLRAIARAGRTTDGPVTLDLHSARHLDPDVLLRLRALAASTTTQPPNNTDDPGHELPPVSLTEPAELPVCLAHVAIDGAVLDQLKDGPGDHTPGCTISHGSAGEDELIDDFQLCQYYEGSLDPASTVRALSDEALTRLTDALYRHLDSPGPSFGARTWFELATDEMVRRRIQDPALTNDLLQTGTT